MSAIPFPVYREGDRVASIVRRDDGARAWQLATVTDVGRISGLVTAQFDHNGARALFHADDLNVRHAGDVPLDQVDDPAVAVEVAALAGVPAGPRVWFEGEFVPHGVVAIDKAGELHRIEERDGESFHGFGPLVELVVPEYGAAVYRAAVTRDRADQAAAGDELAPGTVRCRACQQFTRATVAGELVEHDVLLVRCDASRTARFDRVPAGVTW